MEDAAGFGSAGDQVLEPARGGDLGFVRLGAAWARRRRTGPCWRELEHLRAGGSCGRLFGLKPCGFVARITMPLTTPVAQPTEQHAG